MESKTIKHLLKLIILIIAVSYIVDKIVFYGLNKISDKVKTGQAIGKLNHFLHVKDSVDFLVFGNSRANHHIDVDMFSENSFNIGVDGTGIAYVSTLISTLERKKKQFIIVHIDTKDFFESDYDASDIRSLKSKFKRNEKITSALEESGQISFLQKIYYSMNYNGNVLGILKNYFSPNYNYSTYNGYDPLTVAESQKKKRSIILETSDDSNICSDSLKINPIALKYLKKIKLYSEKSNKKFLFITSPIYNDKCQFDNKKLNEVMNEYNLNYFDFTDIYKQQKDISFWKDKTHMSKEGSENFSKVLLKKYPIFKN